MAKYFAEIVGPHGVRYETNQTTLNECRLKGVRGITGNMKRSKSKNPNSQANIFRESDKGNQTQVGRIYFVQFYDDRMLGAVYRDYTRDTDNRIINVRDGSLSITLDTASYKYGGIREYF